MINQSRNKLRDPLWWLFMMAMLAPLVARIAELSGGGSMGKSALQPLQDAAALVLGTCCILCAVRGRGYGKQELSRSERIANLAIGIAFFFAVLVFRLVRMFVE